MESRFTCRDHIRHSDRYTTSNTNYSFNNLTEREKQKYMGWGGGGVVNRKTVCSTENTESCLSNVPIFTPTQTLQWNYHSILVKIHKRLCFWIFLTSDNSWSDGFSQRFNHFIIIIISSSSYILFKLTYNGINSIQAMFLRYCTSTYSALILYLKEMILGYKIYTCIF